MKYYIFLLVLFLITSCIPISLPRSIPTYKIKSNKIKVGAAKKRFKEYRFEISNSDYNLSKFLKDKFNSTSCNPLDLCYKKVLINNIEQQFIFKTYTKKVKVINLLPIFFKSNPKTAELSTKKYIGITVKDDFNYDYLGGNSAYKEQVITYLSQLKLDYIAFIQWK